VLVSDHPFHHAGAEALTGRLLDHRTTLLGPREDNSVICRKRPFDLDTAFDCRQRPILGRVGCQLVQSYRNRLSGVWLQQQLRTVNVGTRFLIVEIGRKLLYDEAG